MSMKIPAGRKKVCDILLLPDLHRNRPDLHWWPSRALWNSISQQLLASVTNSISGNSGKLLILQSSLLLHKFSSLLGWSRFGENPWSSPCVRLFQFPAIPSPKMEIEPEASVFISISESRSLCLAWAGMPPGTHLAMGIDHWAKKLPSTATAVHAHHA